MACAHHTGQSFRLEVNHMATVRRGKKSFARVKSSRSAKSKPLRTRSGDSREGYEIICSECYSSFSLNPGCGESRITCPDCLHIGELAAKDAMTKIAIAKTAEKAGLIKAVVPAILFLLCGLTYVAMSSGSADMSSEFNYGFLGACSILIIITLAMGFKYESNRYDVYF